MKSRGFTLIELLMVVSIVALLASVVLAALNVARDKGRLGGAKYFATQVEHIAGEQAIGIWDFDECSGTSTADRSGFNNTATFSGSAGWSWSSDTPNGRGCSASLTGTNYLTTPTVTMESSGVNPFTVAFWMKQSTVQNRASMMSTANYSVGGWMIAEGYASPDSKIFFERNYVGSDDQPVSPTSMPLNVWVHVAAVYDGSVMYIYQDGVRMISASSTSSAGTGLSLRIGSTTQGGWGSFTGLLDGVRLFAKALTASEVGNLYATESSLHPLAQSR